MKGTPRVKQSKSSRQKRIRPGYLLIWGFFLSITLSSAWHLYQLHQDVEQRLAELNQEKNNLLGEQKRLENEIVLLNTPSYIEQLAREQLGLVRRGEILIAPKK